MKTLAPGMFRFSSVSNRQRALRTALLLAAGLFLAADPPEARAQNTGTLTTLYTFTGEDGNGAYPNALIQGKDGNFYGTTSTYDDGGFGVPDGTVFRLTPAGVLTTLYRFTGGSDGGRPEAALVQDFDGNLYGTTAEGGDQDNGTVFRISPQGDFARLHSFTSTEGSTPRAALVRALDGNFYGTLSTGGVYNGGTAFRISPMGDFAIFYSFGRNGEGAFPVESLIQGYDGNFYGTLTGTYGPGPMNGAVFRITTTGEFSSLHNFGAASMDGAGPVGTLVQGRDGYLYGTTVRSVGYYTGVVFRVSLTGDYTIIHRFTGNDGADISAGLVQGRDGNFYGASNYGGPGYEYNGPGGDGNLYEITPAGRVTDLYDFTNGNDGWLPGSNLVQGNDGNFYGASKGGASRVGTLFRLTVNPPPAFFNGAVALDNDVYYLAFSGNRYFGYYSYLLDAHYIYHQDLGFEYVFDANDGQGGVYLYDFASNGFFYTSPTFGFPFLYDFNLESVVYYFPDPSRAGRYNTNGTRYFYLYSTGQIITQ